MKTLIAVPCMDTVPVGFVQSMINLRRAGDAYYALRPGSLVHDARNTLAANAIQKECDRVLWIDSDMMFQPDMMLKLAADMDAGCDIVGGIYFKRHLPTMPVIYKRLEYGVKDGVLKAEAESYIDYPEDSLFEVQGCGFGAVMMKTEILKRIWETEGPPFDFMTQIGEDLAFCLRARKLGYRMWCDSRVKVGHIGQLVYDEEVWIKQGGYHAEEIPAVMANV